MGRFLKLDYTPVFKREFRGLAPMQQVSDDLVENEKSKVSAPRVDFAGYAVKPKTRTLDRWLDVVVRVSGSEYVFFSILVALLIWAFLGIGFGTSLTWQAVISDAQAIFSYMFDSLLMRQQLNGYEEHQAVAAEMRSRIGSHTRLLKELTAGLEEDERARLVVSAENQSQVDFDVELPPEKFFGRVATAFSRVLGHIATITLYWVCIFIWLGFGNYCGWSATWELYINSATSALMVFVFAFLANIRERHSAYLNSCLDAIFRVDAALELKLRLLTGDQLSNDCVIIQAPKVNSVQKVIFYYADIIGTLVGIVILFAVIIVWVAVGPLLRFSSGWWLLIGTYAGLVGLLDGFVLRNVQAKLKTYEDPEFAKIDVDDAALFKVIGMPIPEKTAVQNKSLSYKASMAVGRVCAHELMVVFCVFIIAGLLAGSSVMKWKTMGQLISNVPPSIIETFFMIILITGHNYADATTRVDLKNIYERRLKLISFVNVVAGYHVNTVSPKQVTCEEVIMDSQSA
ncbi:hypothetical protein Egran_02919 [Elaphomyces granulatus]|uniref:Low affinity iron permease n=1 Tax=Elaphomyces granulatus TaxID=519963 RepID=A0A232LZ55_9EURO|nr:hypothetical protein Egran_02919 [Elaphomyces granulatus]